ncbi:hypothetical protein BurJ1DRAFT_0408 [Burkholderiales bacterium JOSHI_001]|nr:hypothetical protein BurJ1DRAFT_0408 [Burkholderiales bacterium JOSHI_001]
MKGKIFISYRRASDQWALGQVRQKLVEEYGDDRVFFDIHSIEGGAEWLARLDEAITHAEAVVVLYCKEWFGVQPDGKRRIDDPGDMVRRELEMAHLHHRVIIPVIIDGSNPPRQADLPHSLQFLLKRQFLPLQPDDLLPTRMHRLVQAIERANPGHVFGARYFSQVTWLALVVTALVAAWHALGGNTSYDNAFARNALFLRQQLGVQDSPQPLAPPLPAASGVAAPPPALQEELPELAVVDVDDAEFRTLLGGQRPLDPQLMGIVVWALHAASQHGGACGPKRPVAINLDLAPDATAHDERSINTLNRGLLALAQCRPVVLACPNSVVRRVVPEEDQKWMAQLLKAAPDRLMFTYSPPDPEGLRHTQARTDIGIVAADIAGGTSVAELRNDPSRTCACPSTAQELADCGPAPPQTGWDRSAMVVPFARSALTLSGALLDMPRVASRPIVLIGGSFGAQPSFAVPGRRQQAGASASGTVMQGYLLHGATHHLPVRPQPWMLLLAGGVSWLLCAVVLALGLSLQRNDDRFARRVPAYLGLGAVMLGAPLLTLVAAAFWPAWTWLAGVVAVLAVLTIGRAVLACFEVVLSGGIASRSFRDLWKDVRFDLDKGSAVMKLAGAGLEALLLAACVFIVVTA